MPVWFERQSVDVAFRHVNKKPCGAVIFAPMGLVNTPLSHFQFNLLEWRMGHAETVVALAVADRIGSRV